MNSTKLAVSLGAVTLALTGLTASAATNVVSDPVGFYKIAINEGANSISAPLPNISAFKGTVASVGGDTITFTGTPGFMANQFAPVLTGDSMTPRAQYLVIVCKDADKVDGAADNSTGDWWVIQGNAAGSVTVANGGDTISSFVAAGDTIEVRKLTSLADIFGDGANFILNKDTGGSANVDETDVITSWNGTGVGETFSFLTGFGGGFDGYGSATTGDYGLNGANLTVLPNQALLVYRRAGTGTTNACVLGQVQVKRFTHYLTPGFNAVSHPFAGSGSVASSNLRESAGWVDDSGGNFNTDDANVVFRIGGVGTDLTLSYFNDGLGTEGWFDSNNNFPSMETLDPTKTYFISVKSGSSPIRWRQNAPY